MTTKRPVARHVVCFFFGRCPHKKENPIHSLHHVCYIRWLLLCGGMTAHLVITVGLQVARAQHLLEELFQVWRLSCLGNGDPFSLVVLE